MTSQFRGIGGGLIRVKYYHFVKVLGLVLRSKGPYSLKEVDLYMHVNLIFTRPPFQATFQSGDLHFKPIFSCRDPTLHFKHVYFISCKMGFKTNWKLIICQTLWSTKNKTWCSALGQVRNQFNQLWWSQMTPCQFLEVFNPSNWLWFNVVSHLVTGRSLAH